MSCLFQTFPRVRIKVRIKVRVRVMSLSPLQKISPIHYDPRSRRVNRLHTKLKYKLVVVMIRVGLCNNVPQESCKGRCQGTICSGIPS